jgi:hypothetical protein
MFFILGYIFADGNVFHHSLTFNCSANDDDILFGIKKELGAQRELFRYTHKNKSGSVSKMVKLSIAHKGLVETLANRWQIFPGKGDLDCDFPLEYIDLYPGHYIRGFNAGDGANGYTDGIRFYSSFNYVDQLANYLSEKLGIPSPGMGVNGSIYSVYWRDYEDRLKLYEFMFPEGDYLYSKRKKLEIEVGLGIYPEGLKRFQLTVTRGCRQLKRYLRECGCVIEKTDYRYNRLIFCTFSDDCLSGIGRFSTVGEIIQLDGLEKSRAVIPYRIEPVRGKYNCGNQFKGVSLRGTGFQIAVRYLGQPTHLFTLKCQFEAALVYNYGMILLYGESVYLNEISSDKMPIQERQEELWQMVLKKLRQVGLLPGV